MTFHDWNPTWNGFHPARDNQIWENPNTSCQISLIWVACTLSRNVEMHQICLHAITLERNRPPSNAKLVLSAKWKCDVLLCGCRKQGTEWTDQKSSWNSKSSMQWVSYHPGFSETIYTWLARGNWAECSGPAVSSSLSVWHRNFVHRRSHHNYQVQMKEISRGVW